jgi:hypothetical protein
VLASPLVTQLAVRKQGLLQQYACMFEDLSCNPRMIGEVTGRPEEFGTRIAWYYARLSCPRALLLRKTTT